jgi:xylan 1,4-beta-xylosidase
MSATPYRPSRALTHLRRVVAVCVSVCAIAEASWRASRAASVTGSVDWNALTGVSATNTSYGLNVYDGFDPAIAGVPGNDIYKANVAAMKAGVIRYHYGGQTTQDSRVDARAWVIAPNAANYRWDARKINRALSGAYTYGPEVMMDIANWPGYLATSPTDYRLDPNRYRDFARFCAQLVRIVNKDPQHPRYVKRWEVFNELENGDGIISHGVYEGFAGLAEVGRIFNMCVAAMKSVDPTILVGGPAFARADVTTQVDGFFSTAAPNLDFVSYHSYYAGTTCGFNPADQQVFDNAVRLGDYTAIAQTEFARYSPRMIEFFHDEFNISYCPPDARMTNEVGAVYDALSLLSITRAHATGALAWNEADGWYGKLDGSFARRPGSYTFQFFNEDLSGPYVASSSSDSTKVVVQGVRNGTYDKVCLVNRSGVDQTVQLSFSGFSPAIGESSLFTVKQVYAYGASYGSVTYSALTGEAGFTLPTNTVTVLVINDPGASPRTRDSRSARGGRFVYLARDQEWVRPTADGAPERTRASVRVALRRSIGVGCAIRLDAESRARVRVVVTRADGGGVARVFDGALNAGTRTIEWDGRASTGGPAPAGVYLISVTSGSETRTYKWVLLR